MSEQLFPAEGDPACKHRSHYECTGCHRLFCARCGAELAISTENWKAIGYWCPDCLRRETEP